MESKQEVIVGVLFLAALTLLGIFTIMISDYNPFVSEEVWEVWFEDVGGLRKGDEVRSMGVEVGRVRRVIIDNFKVVVRLGLHEELPFYEDGKISIELTSPLGGRFVDIDPGSPHLARVDTAKPLKGQKPAQDISTALSNLIEDISESDGTIAKLIRDPQVYDDIAAITQSIRQVSQDISEGKGLIGKLTAEDSEAVYEDLEAIAASIRQASDELAEKRGTLGKLIYDDALYAQLDAASKSIEKITADLEAGKGTLGKLLTEDELHDSIASIAKSIEDGEGILGQLVKNEQAGEEFNRIIANLDEITTAMQQGEGTLGKLLRDDQVYADAAEMMGALKEAADKIAQGEGTIGKLITKDELYVKIDRLVSEITAAAEDYREAAPITAFSAAIFAGFR